MFGSSHMLGGWCREKQDAQVLACLNSLSRFYCHAQHHGMQVLTGPSEVQRQGLGRHSALLRLAFRGLLLCTSEEIYLIQQFCLLPRV